MHKYMLNLLSISCRNVASNSHKFSVRFNSTSSIPSKEKWDLLTAVCVERKPVIAPPLNEMEQKFKALLEEVEYEQSSKSDHEVRHEADLKQMESLKKGHADLDPDVQIKQTAQDFLDACLDELAKFKPASKITDADKKGDVKSLNRKLDRNLVLVVNQKVGNKSFFILPQGLREEGETLRQTADRILKQTCGNDLKFQIYGNAPSSFYKYKYPKGVREKNGSIGAKIFIYFARYLNGNVTSGKVDYKWLDRTELHKCLPPHYKASVLDMLVDE